MRRGRPSDIYPQDEFRNLILGLFIERGLSLRLLESLSGVNRGTLSGVLNGKRPCEREDRAAIMRALGIAPEIQTRFLPMLSSNASEHELILLDGRISGDPHLRRAQTLMSQALFPQAYRAFRHVHDEAFESADILLQADAAAWLAWFHGELERFDDARQWAGVSIRLIENHIGAGTDEIINSITVSQPMTDAEDRAAQILSRAWRIYSKILAVKIVHEVELFRLPEAKRAFERSLRIDANLQLPELGHGLRWRAVALSAEDGSQLKDVEDLLSASRVHFARGTAGEASLVREEGVIRWQKNRPEKAAGFLWDAKDRIASFGDARALGPTYCVLSKTILQAGGEPNRAGVYALAAAALHPYGYVLHHAAEQLRCMQPLERQRRFNDLLAGNRPFDTVHQALDRVTAGSPLTTAHLLERNLSRVRAALRNEAFPLPIVSPTKPADLPR